MTVFAPSNAAFEQLASSRRTTLASLGKAPDLGELLFGHVCAKAMPTNALTMVQREDTLREGAPLAFLAGEGGRMRVIGAGSGATKASIGRSKDIVCRNG